MPSIARLKQNQPLAWRSIKRRQSSLAKIEPGYRLSHAGNAGLPQSHSAFIFERANPAIHFGLGGHHRLVCTNCDTVVEFDKCMADGPMQKLADQFDFQIHNHLLEFQGLCGDCRI